MSTHVVEITQAVTLSGTHALHRSIGNAAEELASSRIHGHSYEIEAAVELPIDPATGMALDAAILRDALLDAVSALEGRIMDAVLGAPATSENLAVWFWGRLKDDAGIPGLTRITVRRPSTRDAAIYRGKMQDHKQ